jgi:hypothetical protein
VQWSTATATVAPLLPAWRDIAEALAHKTDSACDCTQRAVLLWLTYLHGRGATPPSCDQLSAEQVDSPAQRIGYTMCSPGGRLDWVMQTDAEARDLPVATCRSFSVPYVLSK